MIERKTFFYTYDLDATTYKYGRLGGPGGYPSQGQGGVKTSGSSTTVTAVTSTNPGVPFGPVLVGDVIVFVVPPETSYIRKVATKTSNTQIAVDSAVTLAGTGAWYFYPFRVGATAAYGWHPVSDYRSITVYFDIPTLASTGGVDYSIETISEGSNPIVLSQGTLASTGTYTVNVSEVVSVLRVGLKAHTAATGTDSITVWAAGDLRGGRS